MKYHSFYLILFFFTLFTGFVVVSPWFSNLLSSELLPLDEIKIEHVEIQTLEQTQKLTFTSSLIACGSTSGHPSSTKSYSVSDGTKVTVTSIENFKSEKEVRKAFELYLEKASEIFKFSQILDNEKNEIGKEAMIRIKESVLIVRFSETKSDKKFQMNIIEAFSLRHALAFKEDQESFRKSAVMWSQIKP